MNLRKSISATLTVTAISATVLAATSANSQTAPPAPSIKAGVALPGRDIFALTTDNSLYVLRANATQYSRLGRIEIGNAVGIDFRPADNTLYALSDTGQIFRVNTSVSPPTTALVSTMTPRFIGGYANVMDFNPQVNALRVTGTNDQNLAVVNTNGDLATTALQTKLAYVAGDPAAGQDPEISGGAYSNNTVGTTTTIFYMVDHARDTLVSIATITNGSSATGGGSLKTLGNLVDATGAKLDMSPSTDIDIFTDASGRNFLVGQTTRLLFSIDLSQVNINLPAGQTQNIVVQRGAPGIQLPVNSPSLSGGVIDIAVSTR
jgi:hypothetical protein